MLLRPGATAGLRGRWLVKRALDAVAGNRQAIRPPLVIDEVGCRASLTIGLNRMIAKYPRRIHNSLDFWEHVVDISLKRTRPIQDRRSS